MNQANSLKQRGERGWRDRRSRSTDAEAQSAARAAERSRVDVVRSRGSRSGDGLVERAGRRRGKPRTAAGLTRRSRCSVTPWTTARTAAQDADDFGGGRRPRVSQSSPSQSLYPDKAEDQGCARRADESTPTPSRSCSRRFCPWLQANAEREGVPYVILQTDRIELPLSLARSHVELSRSSRTARGTTRGRNQLRARTSGEFEIGGAFEARRSSRDEPVRRTRASHSVRSRTRSNAFGQAVSRWVDIDELAPLPVPEN